MVLNWNLTVSDNTHWPNEQNGHQQEHVDIWGIRAKEALLILNISAGVKVSQTSKPEKHTGDSAGTAHDGLLQITVLIIRLNVKKELSFIVINIPLSPLRHKW